MAYTGQVINGNFRIIKTIDTGGMARIYLARDLRLSKQWVVKEIPKHPKGEQLQFLMQSAVNEAELIKQLDHPGIVRIVDIAEEQEAIYIIEDYVCGKSLRNILNNREISGAEFFSWANQICEILHYLHRQNPPIIYRDMKPDNLILTESGHIKLIDFGIARRYSPEKQQDTTCLGTRRYAAPEQYEGSGRQTDVRSDIFSLGRTLQELAAHCRELSPNIRGILSKCVEEEPQSRYQDVRQLESELKRLQNAAGPERQRLNRLLKRGLIFAACFISILALRQLLSVKEVKADPSDTLHSCIEKISLDQRFTLEEEEELLILWDRYQDDSEDQAEAAEFAREIAKLYWFDYQYESALQYGILQSEKWLLLGRAQYEDLQNYLDLCAAYRQLQALSFESQSKEAGLNVFLQIQKLGEMLLGSSDPEVSLEMLRLIFYSISHCLWEFIEAGVLVEEISALLEQGRVQYEAMEHLPALEQICREDRRKEVEELMDHAEQALTQANAHNKSENDQKKEDKG